MGCSLSTPTRRQQNAEKIRKIQLYQRPGEKKRGCTKCGLTDGQVKLVTEWPCKVQSQVETGKQKSLEELVEFYAELAEATALRACQT